MIPIADCGSDTEPVGNQFELLSASYSEQGPDDRTVAKGREWSYCNTSGNGSERGLCQRSVGCSDDPRCAVNEWQSSTLPRAVMDHARAAIFLLRARAARFEEFCSGLIPLKNSWFLALRFKLSL